MNPVPLSLTIMPGRPTGCRLDDPPRENRAAPHDPPARRGYAGDQGQAFPPEIIHDRQNAEAAIGQGIAEEVRASAVPCGLRAAYPQTPPAPAAFADLEMPFAV